MRPGRTDRPDTLREVTFGAVRFMVSHRTLALVANTLGQSLALLDTPPGPTDVWLGAHRFRRITRTPGRRQVVVQTEQIMDADGRVIWPKMTRRRIARLALKADLFVEWNPQNRAFYGLLPRLLPSRFLFGPYVFPDRFGPQVPGEGLVFFGAPNARRSAVLAAHPQVRIAPSASDVAAIDAMVARAAALVNVHSLPGAYSEVPRVLMAVLAGKPLVSEPLGAPFVAGQDHVELRPHAGPDIGPDIGPDTASDTASQSGLIADPEALARAYAGMCALARGYSIARMFAAAGPAKVTGADGS